MFLSIPNHILLPQQLWNFRPFEGAFIVSQIFILSPGVVQVIPEERPSGRHFSKRFSGLWNQPVFPTIPRSQMLNVWPIYLQNWVVLGVNVGKYTNIPYIEHPGLEFPKPP